MIGGPQSQTHVDGSFVPVPTSGVVAVDADGEAVLVDEVTGYLHLVNASGALLWACFDGESSISEVCFDVADQMDVPFEQVLTDTVAVTAELRTAGLLDDARSPGPDHSDRLDRLDRGRLDLDADRLALDPDDQALDVPRRPRLLAEPPSG